MDSGESKNRTQLAWKLQRKPECALILFFIFLSHNLSIFPCPPVVAAGEIMQYLLLIYHNESDWERLGPSHQATVYQEYRDLIQRLVATGKYIAGDELKPTTTATTVRVREGRQNITDGPFAETKEQLGGYFLVNASDLDEAIAIAAEIPSARDGSIEIRPVAVQEQAKQAS